MEYTIAIPLPFPAILFYTKICLFFKPYACFSLILVLSCQLYAEAALDQSGRVSVSKCGFLWGRTGIYAVTAVVRDRSNNQAGVQSLVDVLQEVFQASINDNNCPYDDWDR